jgi:hypothetical protein
MWHSCAASICLGAAVLIAGDEPSAGIQAQQKQRLSKLQPLVGAWRGVGQPQRGSTRDSWTEEANWAWSFEKEPALVADLPKGRYFSRLRLVAPADEATYVLQATPAAGGEPSQYTGQLDDHNVLVLTAEAPRDDLPRRLSFRFVAGGDRLLVLMEKQAQGGDALVRLAEVGYTRQGSGFGKATAQRECIVTGGLGTIEVTHGGKTYYVCCTGCRDEFRANPAKYVREWEAKRKK